MSVISQHSNQQPTKATTGKDDKPFSDEWSVFAESVEASEEHKKGDGVQTLLPSEVPSVATRVATEEFPAVDSFDLMELKESLLRGIYAMGYEKPSAIQQRAITPVIARRDTIAHAQSGCGKTATFSIGMLQRIEEKLKRTQGVVLAPTKELASQIADVIKGLSSFMPDIRVSCLVGGGSIKDDISALRQGVQVVVGTPGRVHHMIREGHLRLDDVKLFVLDEADEMLSQGFLEQIKDIFKTMPETVQAAIFSATLPLEIFDVTQQFMRDPVQILVKNEEVTLQGIKQYYVAMEQEAYKLETVCDLYANMNITQAIIFCNR